MVFNSEKAEKRNGTCPAQSQGDNIVKTRESFFTHKEEQHICYAVEAQINPVPSSVTWPSALS